jgi:protein-L-isoaspartate(D-aspartate) O-methyltransferase
MNRKKIDRLAACRQFYAKMVAAGGGQLREDLERAFEIVPREYFLGPGPWLAVSSLSGMFVATPTDDPIHVYQNVLFALDRQKQINNGEPFLHGQLLGALAPARGNVALHIGCGTGYYTAILAHLVGPSGKVVAYEIEPELGQRARENLKPWDNVEVRIASGVDKLSRRDAIYVNVQIRIASDVDKLPSCDAIYVNAGATRPVAGWLDALNEGGKLLFPLVGLEGAGVPLLLTKLQGSIAAKVIGYCGFVPCRDAYDPAEAAKVTAAFRSGKLRKAQSLIRNDEPDDNAVLVGKGWWLSK